MKRGILMQVEQKNNLKLNEFLGRVNAYRLSFLPNSITGRLLEQDGDYLKIQLKSGSEIVAHIDSLVSIWHIRQPEAV
jgi:hypothetical protein